MSTQNLSADFWAGDFLFKSISFGSQIFYEKKSSLKNHKMHLFCTQSAILNFISIKEIEDGSD